MEKEEQARKNYRQLTLKFAKLYRYENRPFLRSTFEEHLLSKKSTRWIVQEKIMGSHLRTIQPPPFQKFPQIAQTFLTHRLPALHPT